MKKKIGFAILLVVILSLVGTCVYFYKSYYNTDKGRTKIYQKERTPATKENFFTRFFRWLFGW